MTVKNTLAYYGEKMIATAKKSFLSRNVLKLFFSSLTFKTNERKTFYPWRAFEA